MPQRVTDVTKHECLTATEFTEWPLNGESLPVLSSLSVNDNHMLKSLAIAGQGIIMVPEYLVDKEIASGQLITVLPQVSTVSSATYLMHPQLIHQSARLSRFIEFTLQWIANNLPPSQQAAS
jgi:DNA-binding transcriptional LysR family regulator